MATEMARSLKDRDARHFGEFGEFGRQGSGDWDQESGIGGQLAFGACLDFILHNHDDQLALLLMRGVFGSEPDAEGGALGSMPVCGWFVVGNLLRFSR